MRTLAIDYGTRRIGLALSDESGRLATPYEVLEVSSPDPAIDPILRIIEKEGVERVLVGVPLKMDGTVGLAAREVIAWSRRLRTGTQLVFVDERLSSFAAEQQITLRKRGGEKITRKQKKKQLDALVAAELLQAYLDGKLEALDVSQHDQ